MEDIIEVPPVEISPYADSLDPAMLADLVEYSRVQTELMQNFYCLAFIGFSVVAVYFLCIYLYRILDSFME